MRAPHRVEEEHSRAMLLGVDIADASWPVEESLKELARLAETAGIDVAGTAVQKLRNPHPSTYLGKGRIEDLREEEKSRLRFDTVIADDELSPVQQRNLEENLHVQ